MGASSTPRIVLGERCHDVRDWRALQEYIYWQHDQHRCVLKRETTVPQSC